MFISFIKAIMKTCEEEKMKRNSQSSKKTSFLFYFFKKKKAMKSSQSKIDFLSLHVYRYVMLSSSFFELDMLTWLLLYVQFIKIAISVGDY